jgi:cytochrome c2
MPRFFNQSNNNDEDSQNRTNQEIHAIVHYLFKNSSEYGMDSVPIKGDAKNGELLVSSLGCLGCHQIAPDPLNQKTSIETLRKEQGPNLVGTGSKTSLNWVYSWLKDPQKYSSSTRMPNLRLTNQEAADIASYLSSLTKKGFSEKSIPSVDEEVLDEITLDFLKKMNSDEDSRIKRAEMTFEEKLDYNGEKLIRMYGCFGCHDIPGFENNKPIGTELTFEGSKLVEKLDFGFIEISHSREAWFTQKLKEPRIFDRGKVKLPDEKLLMPNFDFTDDEITAIVTALIGFVKDEIPESKIPERNERNLAIEAGEELIRIYNCLGCHTIDGEGGAIRPTIVAWLEGIAGASSAEDASLIQSFAPPILDTEGRKVQPEWLFNFLNRPTMIRPNLQVRMPTYEVISDKDWNKIIKYFQLKDGQTLAYENPHQISKSSSSYMAGDVIQDLGACNNCHFYGSTKPKQAALTWAPNLSLTKERLRSEWVLDWLRDPQAIIPGTKMPTPYVPIDEQIEDVESAWGKDVAKLHPDSEAMLKALRDYLWGIEGQQDVSAIVKRHLETEGYGFIVEDEEDEW